MKTFIRSFMGLLLVMILIGACSKDNDYGTFDTTNFEQSSRQLAFLSNSINTQNEVIINGLVSGDKVVGFLNEILNLNLNLTKPAAQEVSGTVTTDLNLVNTYNSKNNTDYILLPSNAYSISGGPVLSISKGSTTSKDDLSIQFNSAGLELGKRYILPLILSDLKGVESSVNINTVYVFVNIPDQGANVSTEKPGGYRQILYVEVNDNNPLNAGSYYLGNSNIPFFDVVNLFAANINYDNVLNKPYIFFNPQVTSILTNREKYIAPLQKKGIKVVLALLNNHQGVGFDNFISQKSINEFAAQVKHVVDYYQLDGIDIDDEYADYGTNGQPRVNDSSLVLLVKRLREIMPDKIISFYYFSDAISIPNYSAWNGLTMGQYIDYTYQGSYGRYAAPNVAGLTDKSKIGPYSVNLANNQRVNTLTSNATNAKNAGYGIFMWYNLSSTHRESWFSAPSQVYYGENVIYNGESFGRDY